MKISLKAYAYKIVKTPPRKLLKVASSRVASSMKNKWNKISTIYLPYKPIKHYPELQYSYVNLDQLDTTMISIEAAQFLSEMYLQHRFDLLGSGWVKVDYNVKELGVGGYKYGMSPRITHFDAEGEWLKQILLPVHHSYASYVWKQIGEDYLPIDWQMDYKSGYRWDNQKWFMDQRIGAKPGVDIKVPWELARMQHLPQMAVFAKIKADIRSRLIHEFRNQVLDFISTNPVRMGVNWRCTMDVAIRCVNMVLAYDLFQQMDEHRILDEAFRESFARSLYEHGQFIVQHFEWSDVLTSNHYLSNVCGLLFLSAYLARTRETDEWLAFAVQEIIQETEKQFHEDGSNFEASISYHRLSGEMVLYSAALIYGIRDMKEDALQGMQSRVFKRLNINHRLYDVSSSEFFKTTFLDKLFQSGCFAVDITKPNGDIVQIGDNDSGRFIRLSPNGSFLTKEQAESVYKNLSGYTAMDTPDLFWDENTLNHGTFISGISGLFTSKKFDHSKKAFPLEASVVRSLSSGNTLKWSVGKEIKNNSDFRTNPSTQELTYTETTMISIPNESALQVECKAYPDFGVYVYRSDRIFLSLMAGHNGQRGNAGHTHNDKLSIVLQVDGKDIYTDPGTYVYTALPDERNRFRSVLSHSTINVNGQEQNESLTLFSMKDDSKCEVLHFNDHSIAAIVRYREVCHKRSIEWSDGAIRIKDECNYPFQVNFNEGFVVSNGYGKLINRRAAAMDR